MRIFCPWRMLRVINRNLPENSIGDLIYANLAFRVAHRRWPSDQQNFCDALHKIKTSSEIMDPLRVFTTDKEYVKLYIAAVAGSRYVVPTIAILKTAIEIDNFVFSQKSCIKPTHLSGAVLFTDEYLNVDRDLVKKWLLTNHYNRSRERNYKYLRPKVIIEPVLFDDENVKNYLIFCYEGVPKLVRVDFDVISSDDLNIKYEVETYYSIEWQRLNVVGSRRPFDGHIAKPANMSEMLETAAALSRGFSFVRIDLYSDGNKCLVGEITHCTSAGLGGFKTFAMENVISQIIFR